MKKSIYLSLFVITFGFAFSFSSAQGTSTTASSSFLGDMYIKIYCKFTEILPIGDKSACNSNILIEDATSTKETTQNLSETKLSQINNAISTGINTAARVVYVPVKGDKGENGTTTIVYETRIGGAIVGPAAYISAGSGFSQNPFQTTVPGDIWSTFIHLLRWETATGDNANITNINATSTYSVNLSAVNATVTNLAATNASLTNSTSTNLFSKYASFTESTSTMFFANQASITSATTTYLFSAFANFLNLFVQNLSFENATGTNLQVANASTTNLSATGTSMLTSLISTNATLTNATITNLRVLNCAEGNVICNGGNDTVAVPGLDAPLTVGTLNAGHIVFITGDAGFPSVTPGSTKLLIENMVEGTGAVRISNDLKVGKNIVASGTITTTNLVATSSFTFATGTISSTTIQNANLVRLLANNATVTNSTSTNLYSNFGSFLEASSTVFFTKTASITNATTTNLFSAVLTSITSTFTNLLFGNATGTNATTTNFFTSAFSSNNSNITNLYAASSTLMNANLLAGNATLTSLVAVNATTTNFFATNIFANIGRILNFNFQNATGTNLVATGTSNLASIISASSTLTNTNILSGRAVLTQATITNATITGAFYVGGASTFVNDMVVNNSLNVDSGSLFVNDVDERVGINTATPITAGNVRLTVAGDIRVGTTRTNGCVQRFDGNALTGTCSSDETLKENVVEVDAANILNKISNLKFVSYSWNDLAEQVYGNVKGTKILGVTAQNVEAQFPELVTTDEAGYKRVNLTDLHWYIFASVKELIKKVNGFDKEVKTEKLCIGNTCITEGDLQEFKNWKAAQNTTVVEEVVDTSTEVEAPVVVN